MTIRLDTYPAKDIAAATGSIVTSTMPPLLSCLLHSGALREQQHLAVWVGGMSQPCIHEEKQEVFSWQCGVEVEIEIHLVQAGRTHKAWRGWWKGDTTIAHMGSLALLVFCGGKEQRAGQANALPSPPPAPLSSSFDQRNGLGTALLSAPSASSAIAVLEWPPLASASLSEASPQLGQKMPQEDDLWSETEHEEADAETTQEDEEEMVEEDEAIDEEEWEDEESEGSEEDPPSPLSPPSATESFAIVSAPAGTTIAAVHASSAWTSKEHERVVTQLADVLATMPGNTVLVDLRQHAPTPRSNPSRRVHPRARSRAQEMGLTKEMLRTSYGARYWDRGATIPTSSRLASGRPSRWYRVLSNPQSEGLSELVTALEQGFSLLLLGSIVIYAESERAAVIGELRQRVANLTVGPCS